MPWQSAPGQTISQPYIVARMTEALELGGAEQVLEIGTGSGYQAAVLARLLPDGHLSNRGAGPRNWRPRARRRLSNLGCANLTVELAGPGLRRRRLRPL